MDLLAAVVSGSLVSGHRKTHGRFTAQRITNKWKYEFNLNAPNFTAPPLFPHVSGSYALLKTECSIPSIHWSHADSYWYTGNNNVPQLDGFIKTRYCYWTWNVFQITVDRFYTMLRRLWFRKERYWFCDAVITRLFVFISNAHKYNLHSED